MTETGMSLGTPHYMSPEQAMGEREITARSDVYALGAVLYEMLTGEPPFSGPTAQAIVAKVMTAEPVLPTQLRRTVPEPVEDAVLTALQKLPADRFATAAQFAAALTSLPGSVSAAIRKGPTVARLPRSARWRGVWVVRTLATALILTGALALWFAREAHRKPPQPVARFEIRLPDARGNSRSYNGNSFAIAPDGSRIVYVGAGSQGRSRLWVRERNSLEVRPIEGTAGADGPFFSPDGGSIGYFADGRLFKVSLGGGVPIALADSTNTTLAAGAWLADGSIVYTNAAFALLRIPENGGTPVALNQGLSNHPPVVPIADVFPTPLPRRDAILFTTCSNNCARMSVGVLNLRTHERKMLVDNAARAWYAPTGHLVYVRPDGDVFGVPFDLDALAVRGGAVPLLSGVLIQLGIVPELGISGTGTLVYLAGRGTDESSSAMRVDRHGKATPLDSTWRAPINSLALSPDGTRLAVSIIGGGRTDIWIKQLDAGPLTRLTFEGTLNYRPAWTPDGRSVDFTSDRTGRSLLYNLRADGSGKPERRLGADSMEVDEALWSADGRWLVFRVGVADGQRDIYARRSGDSTSVAVVASRFDEYEPALSPDGRWLAYVSAESGREEVYVRPFPQADRARWQVSTAGGAAPVWAHNGRELFYTSRTDSLVAVEVSGTPDFHAGAQQALFPLTGFQLTPFHQGYAVTPDDRAFIMLQSTAASGGQGSYLRVVLNWYQELEAKMGKQ